MARPMIWPAAQQKLADCPDPPQPTLLEGLDASGLAAAIGPELSRLFGVRISAHVAAASKPVSMLAIGQIRLAGPGGPAPVDLLLDTAGAAILIERLFGNRPSVAAESPQVQLAVLPPGSGSWLTPCRFIATATGRAMAAVGHAVAAAPTLPARAVQAAPATRAARIDLALDIDGWAAVLSLIDPAPPAAEPAPTAPALPDPELWRRRARDRALELDLPVTLRLADSRMPLAEVAALSAGDVIPLVQPRMLSVLVAGKRFADIPTEQLTHASPASGRHSRRGDQPDAPGVPPRTARSSPSGDGA